MCATTMLPFVCYTVLKQKLSRIPDQIQDRSGFLQTIRYMTLQVCLFSTVIHSTFGMLFDYFNCRDIASAIKDVLDAVNELSHKHQDIPKMMEYKKVLFLFHLFLEMFVSCFIAQGIWPINMCVCVCACNVVFNWTINYLK